VVSLDALLKVQAHVFPVTSQEIKTNSLFTKKEWTRLSNSIHKSNMIGPDKHKNKKIIIIILKPDSKIYLGLDRGHESG
jgi:hypothetical protein